MVAVAQLVLGRHGERAGVTAVVDDHGSCTFGELDARVNQLVDAGRTAGLGVGDTVAVMCGNRRELIEWTIAAVHAGWVVVPVNWHWVADELSHVLTDSGANALVVEAPFAGVAAAALEQAGDAGGNCGVRVVIGDAPPQVPLPGFTGHEAFVAAGSAAEPAGQVTGGPMFYTSGTTGFPKGVRGTLSRTGEDLGLWELVSASFLSMLGLPHQGVTLADGPLYHSAQWVFALFPLLGGGSTLVLRPRFDPRATLEAIDAHGVTNVHLVPTQFIRLLKLDDATRNTFDGSSLVAVVHGAAPCPVPVKERMLTWWGPVITEYYGGTEGGFLTTISASEWLEHPGSIGQETVMAEVVVLDDDGAPCAPGETGQVWFRSRVGADFSYHNDPVKTAAAKRDGGLATLGDVGHLDADGYLYLSDRRIDMIISGGVNIYPAEIEGVLVTHPLVADAAVFGIPDDEFGEQVMAVVELVGSAGPDDGRGDPGDPDATSDLVADLARHCGAHLAGYKVPRTIEVRSDLPRQPTGKLYKRLLRDPYWEGQGRSI